MKRRDMEFLIDFCVKSVNDNVPAKQMVIFLCPGRVYEI